MTLTLDLLILKCCRCITIYLFCINLHIQFEPFSFVSILGHAHGEQLLVDFVT